MGATQVDAQDDRWPPVRTGRQRPWRGVAILLVVCTSLLVLGAGWYVLNRAETPAPKAYHLPQSAIQAAQKDAATAGPAIIYDTQLKPIAPGDALTINAERPDDIAHVVAASAFTVDQAAKDDPHFEAAIQCLAQAIYYEAAGEGEAGERAVAQVVINRVRSLAFPDTVCGVVYQGAERTTGCQFTFTCDGSLMRVPSPTGFAAARGIARQALSGKVDAAVGNATHYHANFVVPYWASSLDKVKTIGSHIFYLMRGPLGGRSAFDQHYQLASEMLPASLANRATDLTPLPADATTTTPDTRLLVAPLPPALAADRSAGRLVHGMTTPMPSASARSSRLLADERSGKLKAGDQPSRLIVDAGSPAANGQSDGGHKQP